MNENQYLKEEKRQIDHKVVTIVDEFSRSYRTTVRNRTRRKSMIIIENMGYSFSDIFHCQRFCMPNVKENKLIIYQILVRLFGNRNLNNIVHGTIEQNGVGKLNDINELCLRELKQFGYTHIWFCGILEHATMTNYEQFGIRRDHPHVVK